MDSRFEGIIKCTYSIGGEKEDASIVFKDPQEYCSSVSLQLGMNQGNKHTRHKTVSCNVIASPLSKKDVGFI